MFWSYNNLSSQIDAVLSKEDVTLQNLLDEVAILQECKSQNKKLMEFLIRPEIMEQLVTLITVEPSDELDEKTRYKYPNIACELLTSDVPVLNEKLANNALLLGKLYSFLESESPLNPLLASYFSKTLSMLVTQKTEQNWYSYQVTCLQVLEFLMSKQNFVPLLIKHLGTSAIMDLTLKLMTKIGGLDIRHNILTWLDNECVVQKLVELLDPSIDPERQTNAAQLLSDIIANDRDFSDNATERPEMDPIVRTIESAETVTLILDHILGPIKSESSIVNGIQVLLALLNFKKSDPNVEQPADKEHREQVFTATANAIIKRLKDFHNVLLDPPKKPPICTAGDLLDQPFGNTRLQIIKLLATLLACDNEALNKEIAELGTVNLLLDLFFKYTWNNFLHTQVQQCIAFALSSNAQSDTNENIMYSHLIVDCRLIGRILEAWDDNEQRQSEPNGRRQGYMGHLVNIANNLVMQSEKTPLGDFIKEHVNKDTLASWETFVNGPLTETNKKNSIFWRDVQEVPLDESQISGKLSINTLLEQPESVIRSLIYPGSDNRPEMFEKLCTERINQLDITDDDYNIWEEGNALDLSNTSLEESQDWLGRRNRSIDDEDIEFSKMDICNDDPWKSNDSSDDLTTNVGDSVIDPWNSNDGTSSSNAQDNWANFASFSYKNFTEGLAKITTNPSSNLTSNTIIFENSSLSAMTASAPETVDNNEQNPEESSEEVRHFNIAKLEGNIQIPKQSDSEIVKSDDNANISKDETPDDLFNYSNFSNTLSTNEENISSEKTQAQTDSVLVNSNQETESTKTETGNENESTIESAASIIMTPDEGEVA